MFHRDFADLRETLFALRLLREEILDAPVIPPDRARLRQQFLAGNGDPAALRVALDEAATATGPEIDRAQLDRLARAAGAHGLRRSPGVPFQRAAAPGPGDLEHLLGELIETINSGRAVEGWPPPVRAQALVFLLRLVQPYEADPDRVARVVEAYVLATDGFRADCMWLCRGAPSREPSTARPDPDAFLRERLHGFVEALGETRQLVRGATARSVLLSWVDRKEARLNVRQKRLLEHLAEPGGADRLTFQQYVNWHAGRGAPSLRSLQRDWKGLRDRGLITSGEVECSLVLAGLALG